MPPRTATFATVTGAEPVQLSATVTSPHRSAGTPWSVARTVTEQASFSARHHHVSLPVATWIAGSTQAASHATTDHRSAWSTSLVAVRASEPETPPAGTVGASITGGSFGASISMLLRSYTVASPSEQDTAMVQVPTPSWLNMYPKSPLSGTTSPPHVSYSACTRTKTLSPSSSTHDTRMVWFSAATKYEGGIAHVFPNPWLAPSLRVGATLSFISKLS
mmetsp:Transcript_26918/g.75248  ORF Transcript_26918/g.75248 Transcript_26918/m.75248 type:complete len:219 (+) Transcript_26918:870-1526(+)